MTDSLVETHNLTKRYRGVTALNACNISIGHGEIYGLLGPNGAGKTTLLRLLMGYLRPTSGTATIAGRDCYRDSVAVHDGVAYLPADARLFPQMRGTDVLRFFARVRRGGDLSRSLALSEQLGLDLSRHVSRMSTGMRQKLALAAVLACDAPLLILDEPTANLDPNVRATLLNMLDQARQEGKTVLFSSHVLDEAEQICDRVCILRSGQLAHVQIMHELKRLHRIRLRLNGEYRPPDESLRAGLSMQTTESGEVVLETPAALAPLLKWLGGLPIVEARIEPTGLRAVYNRFHAEEFA